MDGTFLLQSVSAPPVEFRLAAPVTVLGRSGSVAIVRRMSKASKTMGVCIETFRPNTADGLVPPRQARPDIARIGD